MITKNKPHVLQGKLTKQNTKKTSQIAFFSFQGGLIKEMDNYNNVYT